MNTKTYIIGSIAVTLAMYIIPYVFLKNSEGFELFAFWSLLTIAWIIVSIIYMSRCGK